MLISDDACTQVLLNIISDQQKEIQKLNNKLNNLIQNYDVVEVVRCKDCGSYNKHYNECTLNGAHLGENGLCSCGKRKETVKKSEQNTNELSDEELALINKYTRRTLTSDEVYVFSVVLCDNDIDRDGERFTVESLFALEKLFVGKTGILTTIQQQKNQTARIFACKVEAVDDRKTATGDDYFRLKARAYIIKDECNEDVIRLIDNSTSKEVSISCSAYITKCNICGAKKGECFHKKGEKYGYAVCHFDIMGIYDAYEWCLKNTAKTDTESTEVKHCEWKIVDSDLGWVDGECSTCGYTVCFDESGFYNYCPNCGAKMET